MSNKNNTNINVFNEFSASIPQSQGSSSNRLITNKHKKKFQKLKNKRHDFNLNISKRNKIPTSIQMASTIRNPLKDTKILNPDNKIIHIDTIMRQPAASSSSLPPPLAPISSITLRPNPKKKRIRNSSTSSEEERWLDAIESGKLEQVDDELKKIKDPKLMTARQRAMYERGIDKEQTNNLITSGIGGYTTANSNIITIGTSGTGNISGSSKSGGNVGSSSGGGISISSITTTNSFSGYETLLSLPSGYKEKVMTAEAIEKAQIKSKKRKQLADEKRESDKKKTMERLLKKKDSKSGSKNIKNRPAKATLPVITYKNTLNGSLLIYPENMEFPLKSQKERSPPLPILCAVCSQPKRYNCSKTNIPLCSFKCYKSIVDSLKDIMC